MLLQQLINGVSVGGIYALLATGYALIYSLLGFSNWAHGEVAMLGAYIGILSVASLKMPFIFAVILAVVGAGLISVFNEKIAYKRIRDNNSPTMFLMIAAMGLSTTFQNLAIVVFGPKFKMYPQVLPVGAVKIGNLSVGLLDLVSLAIAVVAIVGLEYLITKTKFGLAVKASSSNMGTASLLGINVDKYIMLVFFLAGGGDGGQCPSVKGIFQGDYFEFFRGSLFPEMKAGQLDGSFVGFSPAVGKEDPVSAGIFYQNLGQPGLVLYVVQAGAVDQLFRLLPDGLYQPGVGMPKSAYGDARKEIIVFSALRIPQVDALSVFKTHRRPVAECIHKVLFIHINNLLKLHYNYLLYMTRLSKVSG